MQNVHLAPKQCNMDKSKTLRTNTAIQKAVRLYFNGKTAECLDMMDSLHLDRPTGAEKSRLKKNHAVAPRR
jgi:hypothetical protein